MSENQQKASHPGQSVWVAANAGSGKTRVLTDRVLRLLLKGTPPHRILCLTYTKAAAAEMAIRIQKQLAEWVRMSPEDLLKRLKELQDRAPTEREIKRARQLFAVVADAPEGLRIQTIHSLCQSLLRRFSVEAGVDPHFRPMDDREAATLMEAAKEQLFLHHRLHEEDAELASAIRQAAGSVSEQGFYDVLKELISRRDEVEKIGRLPIAEYRARLEAALGVAYTQVTEAELAAKYFAYDEKEIAQLRSLLPFLIESDKQGDQKLGAALAAWLESGGREVENWVATFFGSEGEPYKVENGRFMSKAVKDREPCALEWMQREQERAVAYRDDCRALHTGRMSEALWFIAHALTGIYESLKLRRGVLDYDDLIQKARQLLTRPGISSWVMYKLDGGLDHLLVDEAQDTSRAQWEIIEAISSDFFTGESAAREGRTLFVVGDEKQSIFSFQGAEPRAFAEMKQFFARHIRAAEQPYEAIGLTLSYRSSESVLKAVDAVFAEEAAHRGVIFSEAEVTHAVYHNKPGRVELWPLIRKEKEEKEDPHWVIPREQITADKPNRAVAQAVAERIREMVNTGHAAPEDILVLVQRRNAFYHYLLRALAECGVPVAGADRLVLSTHIAVQDMLALAQFLLLPEDDLNLACLLKSPLFGMSEERLFALCHQRPGTLWERLRAERDPAVEMLEGWLARADFLPPFELFSLVLDAEGGRRKFLARLGAQANDPLDELLVLALDYERLHQPSLQGFVHWFGQAETVIKRDMERSAGAVRVMTVHGSKGLEAPIVFLPDTSDNPLKKGGREAIFWWEEKGVALWSTGKQFDPPAITALKEEAKERAMEEYRRLLYVAMTRAADALYIYGWLNENTLNAERWYALMQKGMQKIAVEREDGVLVLENNPAVLGPDPRTQPGQEAGCPGLARAKQVWEEVSDWIDKLPPDEPNPPRPLTPSRPEGSEPAADLSVGENEAIQRGKLIHTLLEILPEVPVAQRPQAAAVLMRREGMAQALQQEVLGEVVAILEHSEFREIFGPGSRAEVPLSATLIQDGIPRVMTGRIDRLLVTERKILLLDYKTNRGIPASAQEIPLRYRRQLESYAQALARIYPGREIHAAILWTSAPLLMPVALSYTQAA